MLTASIYNFTIAANQAYRLFVQGSYFKIISATGALNVKSQETNLKGLITGQGMEQTPFSYLELTDASGASNTVSMVIADEGFIDATTGSVSILGTVPVTGSVSISRNQISSTFANVQKTVTSASAQLLAANAARGFMLVQNNDLSGNIYLNFGAAATTANGIKIGPGGNFEMNTIQSTQAIFAIGDIASNANIVTVEG